MVALIQSKNHAAIKGKTAGRYQFDTHPTRIGLIIDLTYYLYVYMYMNIQCFYFFTYKNIALIGDLFINQM